MKMLYLTASKLGMTPLRASNGSGGWWKSPLDGGLRKTKRQYERWVKIQALWHDTKHEMNIK